MTILREGDVAVLELDDGKANALSNDTIDALMVALDEVDGTADAVVLSGRPGRFSAGFDLGVMRSGPEAAQAMLARGVDLFLRLYLYPRPVVAACTGHAIAAGAIILMSCDLRVGTRGEFKIGLPEVTIGMPLPFFATELARDRISKRHYTRVTALGSMYDPDGAVDAGFLDEAVDGDPVAVAVERAQGLTGISRGGLRRTRTTTRGAIAEAIQSGLADDLSHFAVEGG
ncbi:MAG: crotonase/enoyl-CoA hydratase family protein [Actinomycetota bacterium]|nr:crotonase/enoyl-CoA hydratase family protein [Actinomycetota bacterium]